MRGRGQGWESTGGAGRARRGGTRTEGGVGLDAEAYLAGKGWKVEGWV